MQTIESGSSPSEPASLSESGENRIAGTRVAWITGGGTGIGLATAVQLAGLGWHLVLSGRRKPELDAACRAVSEAGGSAEALALDVSDASAVAAAAEGILARHGGIDALVCSAGTNVPNRHWDALTAESFARVNAINLNGVAFCVAAVLPAMRKAGAGSIAVVSSWAGWRYLPFTGPAYAATKQALSPLVESINDQEGANGIRATHVCPGEVATPILRSRPVPPPEADIARMLRPEDVAQAIVYALGAPAHVCLNEIVISPTWNRIYRGGEDLKRPGT
jgi:NAD(P)-dependent dehydrogenase (short-subunit alcohol dehydrogenase family)